MTKKLKQFVVMRGLEPIGTAVMLSAVAESHMKTKMVQGVAVLLLENTGSSKKQSLRKIMVREIIHVSLKMPDTHVVSVKKGKFGMEKNAFRVQTGSQSTVQLAERLLLWMVI